MTNPRPLLYLIDGHAVAYREYFAMENVSRRGATMATRSGEPTGAVYRFAERLMNILEKVQPEYLAVSFDRGLSQREKLYADYKANRAEMPEDLATQMRRIQQVVEAFNIPVLALEGYEADDVMGTITRQAEAQQIDVHIITGDRDILQLLSPAVRVQLPQRGGDDVIFDEAAFRAKYGLEPHQLVDLKALIGDSSDNIPGVKGIGDKTATPLLQQFGTLEALYANLPTITATGTRTKLEAGRASAFMSRQLAAILRDLPLQLDLNACVAHDFDVDVVDALFAELEFRGLRDRLYKIKQERAALHPGQKVEQDAAHFVRTVIVNTPENLAALVATLEQAEVIVWDVETTGVDQMAVDLVGIALSTDGATGYYIPVGHVGESLGELFPAEETPVQLPLATVVAALRPTLTNPNIAKIAHNASFDLVILRRYGIDVTPVVFDTMIAEWVNDPISKFLGLKNLVRDTFNIEMTEITALIGTGKKQKPISQVKIDDAAPYAAADAALTYRLWQDPPALPLTTNRTHSLRAGLHLTQQQALFETLEMPLIPVIATMEMTGVALDVPFLTELSKKLDADLRAKEERIFSLSGERFNINSPKQLNEVLFDKLKLSVQGLKKTSQGYSTDINTLEALRTTHPVIPVILEYRELAKLKGTYVDALPALVNPRTGRVHTNYNQTGTSTGRFSSSNPNLQNIPIRTELGREVRRGFIAPPGRLLLSVDYSQIELRVMAHISQDATLLEAFRQGQDIHRATAAAVFGIAPQDVTYEQRSFAKRVNFGLMYGMGEYRLARDSDLTLAEAKRFIDTYFRQLPGVEHYIESTKQRAIEAGYLTTLLGRRRYFKGLKTNINSQSAQGELRAAINMPIQGTAADILKLAILRLDAALRARQSQARMILQVHDELVLEVPEDELAETAQLVIATMEGAYELDARLVANAEYGHNWLDMQAV